MCLSGKFCSLNILSDKCIDFFYCFEGMHSLVICLLELQILFETNEKVIVDVAGQTQSPSTVVIYILIQKVSINSQWCFFMYNKIITSQSIRYNILALQK